jgi:hypothetical protein
MRCGDDPMTCAALRLATGVALLLACCPIAWAASPQIQSQVRVIGCPANEQIGSAGIRTGQLMPAPVEQHTAEQLAYYEAGPSPGVFAPAGWACRAWYGSSGSVLVVTPKHLQPPYFPLPMITGPAVTVTTSDGETSGRFHVAIVAAQLFPVFGSAFITQVRQEHLLPDSTFDAQPYPDDQLNYLSDRFVQYTTPPNRAGAGTDGLLQPSDLPISGLSILNPEAQVQSLTEVRIRLPAGRNVVVAAILQLETACVQLQRGCRGLK